MKEDGRKYNGGKRLGAGRKAGEIKKRLITKSVPDKYVSQIKSKLDKIVKAYEDKCKREL